MRKKEFIIALEQLLWDLSEEDRKEALQYYTDYFEDAGIEEEEDVTVQFGTPEKVAARIKVEFTEEHCEYSEQGFGDIRFADNRKTMLQPVKTETIHKPSGSHDDDNSNKNDFEEENGRKVHSSRNNEESQKGKKNVGKGNIAGLILAFIVLSPLLVAVIALVISIVLCIYGGLLGLGIGGIISGIILIMHGVGNVFTIPSLGFISLGVGCIGIAVGIIGVLCLTLLTFKAVPRIGSIIRRLFSSIIRRLFNDRFKKRGE